MEKAMTTRSILVLTAAAAAMSLASPAGAQGVGDRYGSPLPNHYDSSGALKWGSWSPEQQGSGNQNAASQNAGGQSQASASSAQGAQRPGYNAYGQAPAQRSSSRPARSRTESSATR